MNTNETQEIEIPAEWDVTVQGAERRGYRAGVEAMRDEFCHCEKVESDCVICQKAEILLAEQEEK